MSCPSPTTKSILASVASIVLAATPTGAALSKRGVTFDNAASLPSFENTQVSWCWNWASSVGGQSHTGNLDYVPMLKGPTWQYVGTWEQNAQAAIKDGSDYLMAYNEPDINGIDPVNGSAVYRQEMSAKFSNKFLGAPALTNRDETFAWWKTFHANCENCKIDFWPVHWYDDISNGIYFQQFVNNASAFAASKGSKLWITEIGFRGNPSLNDMNSFLNEQLPFLDNNPVVERYSFTATTYQGLDMLSDGETGSLTETGQTYVAK